MATREVRRFSAGGAEFTFDTESGELTGPTGTTRLRPQAATVLIALLSRPNELVSRDELKKLVWPDTVVEADQGLNFCIRQIRAALGDEAENGKFIETLPRRGYRFVAAIDGGANPPAMGRSRRYIAAAGLAAVLAGGWLWMSRGDMRIEPPTVAVAVIPFVAPDSAPWMTEVSSSIVDRLVVELTASPLRIGVVGPATTRSLVNDPRPHTELGRMLSVDLVISGGMRMSDSTLFVQAVRTADGVHTFAWRERVWNRNVDSVSASLFEKLSAKLKTIDRNQP